MGRDMKNRFFKNIARVFAIVAGCLMLASFSPSLDGRAIVVDEGVFPSGLFAKTVGYLPGDIISVTNITGDATIDILVIGALDPSEGVAIMLSPEAATAIGMDKEANNIVKITKRSNQDERVYGSAIIARQDGNTTIPAVTVPDNEVPAKEESFANVEPATENEFNVGNQETTIDNSEPENEAPEVIEDVADDNSEGVIVEEINNGEEYVPDEEWEDDSYEESDDSDDSNDEYSEDNNEVEDSENDKVEELEEEIKEEEIAAEEYEEEYLPEEDVEAEEYTEDDYIPEDDDITDYEEETETDDFDEDYIETEVEEDYDDVIEEEYTEEDIPADEEFIEEEFDEDAEEVLEVEDESEAEIEDPIEEEFEEFEEEILEDEIIEDEEELPEEQLSEEEFIEEPEEIEEEVLEDEIQDDAEEYDAIVLVPAEENISSVIEETESLEAEDEVVEEIVEETEVAEEIEEVILEEVQQIVEETKTVEINTSYSKYVVPNMSDLKKGSYYIQIAVLKSDENILEVTNKYGKKYPLTIVPNADGTKKVMVGPLCVDEYGTVLERFKSYGYKDAFTRKIN